MQDYYTTLGVSPEAPPEVIKAAYRALAQKHHPDRHGNNASSNESTARINDAFRVLSDPILRASYDATRSAGQVGTDVPCPARAPGPVVGHVAGHHFSLRFTPAKVISNDIWNETEVTSRGGGGITVAGFGYNSPPKVRSRSVPKQRLGVRTSQGDIFVDHSGFHIPAAVGQDIELIYAFSDRAHGIVALVNRSSRQWFWVGSQMDAGSLIRKPSAQVADFIAYLCLVALSAGALWAFVVRDGGVFVWAAFIILGIPALLGAATPMLFRTSNRIGAAIRSAICRSV